MRVVIDIETNSAIDPKKIWLVVCKDLDTGDLHVFKELYTPETGPTEEARRFLRFASEVTYWVGHNWLEFDYPCLNKLLGLVIQDVFSSTVSMDTLVLSRLTNYSRGRVQLDDADPARPITRGHSIESYGEEFGYPKLDYSDFTKLTDDMVQYCVRDVEICEKIYRRHGSTIPKGLETEQQFQKVVNELHKNGFAFNVKKANQLLERVQKELGELDVDIKKAFPRQRVLLREFTPRATRFGTISKTSVPRSMWSTIHEMEVGRTYPVYADKDFNPSSHKQLIDVLTEAKWKPIDKTKTHIDAGRELRTIKLDTDRKICEDKLVHLAKYGWKISENNLSTLPPDAPPSARLLARRILLESRRRTLTEWLGLVGEDGRIHGKFYGIGAWTHRMAHQQPNTANIPNEYNTQGKKKLLGKEMRSLWCAPPRRLLVGVDAEGIQLRIFAHYINDPEFTKSLVEGKKDEKTDPHSLNQKVLGSVCKSRQAAKRFIYALLLGAGIHKLAEVLDCNESEATEALDRILSRYQGFAYLKKETIPKDAKAGYFTGLDGRRVRIPGSTVSERRHLTMSGYLQNGEAVVMKLATLKWMKEIEDEYRRREESSSTISTSTPQTLASARILDRLPQLKRISKENKPIIVNFVHDEWQTETSNDMVTALWVAETQSRALREVGEELKLRCPLAGSYWNEDAKDYTVGTNWSVTH